MNMARVIFVHHTRPHRKKMARVVVVQAILSNRDSVKWVRFMQHRQTYLLVVRG